MTDNSDEAHIERDMARLADSMPPGSEILRSWEDTRHHGDGSRLMISFVVGFRGQLSKSKAKIYADGWRVMRTRHPQAIVYPTVVGYDEDPRELWEIPEVVRYVQQFAELAGIERPSDLPPDPLGHLFTFFGAMGVWGEAAKVQATAPMPFGDVGQA
jgi:hypothetical protein